MLSFSISIFFPPSLLELKRGVANKGHEKPPARNNSVIETLVQLGDHARKGQRAVFVSKGTARRFQLLTFDFNLADWIAAKERNHQGLWCTLHKLQHSPLLIAKGT